MCDVVSQHEATFWRETNRYHDLARHFEQNIEIAHPNYVTDNGYYCGWCATNVTYYEHRP